MPEVKTSELTGPALDWAVATALGRGPLLNMYAFGGTWHGWWLSEGGEYERMPNYSTNWSQGGPIIEREMLAPEPLLDTNCALIKWRCRNWKGDGSDFYGPTPLIAAMRCFVTSKLGDEVDVPEELA